MPDCYVKSRLGRNFYVTTASLRTYMYTYLVAYIYMSRHTNAIAPPHQRQARRLLAVGDGRAIKGNHTPAVYLTT